MNMPTIKMPAIKTARIDVHMPKPMRAPAMPRLKAPAQSVTSHWSGK